MTYKTILVEKQDGISKIIMNIPEKLNALDLVMREEMKQAFSDIHSDRETN